jgi:hypothetical protein
MNQEQKNIALMIAGAVFNVAQEKYQGWVRGNGWWDVTPPVRVIDEKTGKKEGVHLVNLNTGEVFFSGKNEKILLEGYKIAEAQGPVMSHHIEKDMWDNIQALLNVVADERESGHDGEEVQTENAIASRTLLNMLFMKRTKGIELPAALRPDRST